MKELYLKYPSDAEVGALYADALMIQHPWDLWQHNGQPKQWTPQIQKVLENVLTYSPDHPGANHYYIHTMEASPYASRANASADRLGSLQPGVAHMVHMPSHIYIRTGQYEKGAKVNRSAVENYHNYLKLYPDVANNAFLYEIHNRHMQAASTMNQSDYSLALKDAVECRKSFDTSLLSLEAPMGDAIQYVYMTPELTMVTFKQWEDIIKQPDVETRLHYAALLQHFAKGMAYANTSKLTMARSSLAKLESLLPEKDLAVVLTPFNAPITGANIAKYILMGTIAEKENNLAAAINYFKKAVATEDSLVYTEPRDWLVPARHFLGNALLSAKKYKEAGKVYREDLKVQPANYVATKGLQRALRR
jgi:tetratricopeptide (TPR) repeat protein